MVQSRKIFMTKMVKFSMLYASLFSFAWASTALCAIPEPKSQGKYFQGKGTRASEEYELTSGVSGYDYGQGLQWGPVHFKPNFDYRIRWDDNVFYEESGQEKNDIVNSFGAEAAAELPLGGGQHLLSGGYRIYRELFNRFDSQNHTDHRGWAGLKLNYVPFTLDLEDVFENTESRSNTEFTDRVERDENAFHSLLQVPFSRFFLENEITNFTIDYGSLANTSFNHNIFTVYQRVGYDWRPNSQILAEYAYLNVDYSEIDDRDGDGNQFMLGLRGNLTELIAYQAWAGAQYRIYDEDTRPDFNDFIFRGALQYQASEFSSLTLKGDRSPQESTFDNQSYYTRNYLELNWRRKVHERIYWNTLGNMSYNEYSRITVRPSTSEAETRRDWQWQAGTGLEYLMPNDIVAVFVDWRYVQRESNLDGLDYEGNQISAGVRASF
jgi:hypothetical protein